jgi:CRISPR system Cascade subunit CasC
MFIQIHMLQSMPPGNLNRDDTGQPKKCVFGGVTRGRISSQCLKRRIRLFPQFKEEFALASRTKYLPQMVADALKAGNFGVPDDELEELMAAIAKKFSKGERGGDSEDAQEEGEEEESAPTASDKKGKKPQLVFFPPPFAVKIAELLANMRKQKPKAYNQFLGRKAKEKRSDEEVKSLKAEIDQWVDAVKIASKSLTVDIGLFGRMTTSDLVVNVEAACQVAHAISTHETVIEHDWFTAMDEEKDKYVSAQSDKAGAGYIGSGENVTYFNAAVYYKYLNVDVAALRDKEHLPSLSLKDAARVAGVLVSAAALATPTGKQNSFAAHGVPELILVEASEVKRPLSYANAFLQAVEGGTGRNLMTESAKALTEYIDAVAAAYAPDLWRVLLAVGPAKVQLQSDHTPASTLDKLVESVVAHIVQSRKEGANA